MNMYTHVKNYDHKKGRLCDTIDNRLEAGDIISFQDVLNKGHEEDEVTVYLVIETDGSRNIVVETTTDWIMFDSITPSKALPLYMALINS